MRSTSPALQWQTHRVKTLSSCYGGGWFHPTLYWAHDAYPCWDWSLIHVSKRGPLECNVSVNSGMTPGGGYSVRKLLGCAVGHWKLDPKRSRGKWYFGAIKIKFCEDLYPNDRFCVGGWEKTPQKDRVWYPEAKKMGSKPRHICITHHIGSTPPPGVMTMC